MTEYVYTAIDVSRLKDNDRDFRLTWYLTTPQPGDSIEDTISVDELGIKLAMTLDGTQIVLAFPKDVQERAKALCAKWDASVESSQAED